MHQLLALQVLLCFSVLLREYKPSPRASRFPLGHLIECLHLQ